MIQLHKLRDKPSPLKGRPSPLKGRPSPLKGKILYPNVYNLVLDAVTSEPSMVSEIQDRVFYIMKEKYGKILRGASRDTVIKYLKQFEAENKIKTKKIGKCEYTLYFKAS